MNKICENLILVQNIFFVIIIYLHKLDLVLHSA